MDFSSFMFALFTGMVGIFVIVEIFVNAKSIYNTKPTFWIMFGLLCVIVGTSGVTLQVMLEMINRK